MVDPYGGEVLFAIRPPGRFVGVSPVSGSGKATLYRDYGYVAVPVGNGPSRRRSFAIRTDGVLRFPTDGAAPSAADPVLN